MPSEILVANKHGRPVSYTPGADATKTFGADGGFGLLYAMAGMAGRNSDLVPSKMGAASAYQLIPAVNRSINLRADAVQSLQWQLLGKDGTPIDDGERQEAATPFGQAMRDAQKNSRISLIEQIVYAHDLYGEVYLEPLGNRYRTTGMKWLNPLGMYVIVEQGELVGFRWSPQNNDAATYHFAADELAYDHLYNPFDDYRGMGLVEVAIDTLNISRNLKRWLMGFFRNNARPGQVISPKPDSEFSPTNRNIIKTEVEMFAKGSDNSYSTLVLPIPMDIANFEQPDINNFYAINEPLSAEIYTIFGVPAAMAGDSGHQRYKSGGDILQAFYTNTIIPLAHWVQDYFNFQVLPYFRMADATFAFGLSEFDTASDDDQKRADIAVAKFAGELITRDEARLYAGDTAVGGELGAQYYTPPVPGTTISVTNPTPQLPPSPAPQAPKLPVPKEETPKAAALPQKALATPMTADTAYVGLSLANDPQIVALQDRLKLLYGNNSDVEWQTPDTLHITLVYCDSATDDHIAGIARNIQSTPMAVHGDKLGIFENNGSRAVYLEIVSSPDLKRLQAVIYGQFKARNLPMSAYSDPKAYTPHVTLCYFKNDELELAALPVNVHTSSDAVTFGRDDYEMDIRVPLAEKSIANALSHRYLTPKQASADAELDAWERKATKGNALKSFVTEHTDKPMEAFIRAELEAIGAGAEKALVRAVFDDARYALGDWSAVKGYEDIAAGFSDAVAGLIGGANDGDAGRPEFAGGMRSALRRYGLQAYRAGMQAGGYDPESFSRSDLDTFRNWQAKQSGYVTGIGGQLYKDDQTPNPDDRSDMWQRKSLNSIYFEGLNVAAPDLPMTWNLGATEQHCPSCAGNAGQTKSVAEWMAQGLPQSDALDCGGFKCDCYGTDAKGNVLGIGEGGNAKAVAAKGLETDEQRRYFFAHLGEGYVTRGGQGGTDSASAPSRESHHVVTLDGRFEPDVGTPGATEDSLNNFLKQSNGPLSYAIANPDTGLVSVDYSRPDDYFTVNKEAVKSEAAAFVKESQNIQYGKDYLMGLAKERAAENGVELSDAEVEKAFNAQYATRAQAIQATATAGGVKLTDAQTRRLQEAADGKYLDMVYSRDDSERGTLTPTAPPRNRGRGRLTGGAQREARRNFLHYVGGIDNI